MNLIEAAKNWIKEHGVIEPAVFEPHPEKPGYLKLVRMRTLGEVWPRIQQALREHESELSIEYVSGLDFGATPSQQFPEQYRWCVYLVEGSNEGFYVHVEIKRKNDSLAVGLVKTLGDWEDALRILNFLTVLVGTWY